MQRRIGNIRVESIAAEREKFTAPILLVHGLWCTGAVWHRFMGYLAHRGWSCHTLTLRGHGSDADRRSVGQIGFADHVADIREVIAACDAPPVILGHDLGGLLVLHCGAHDLRAAVALAPLVPRAFAGAVSPALGSLRARYATWRSGPLSAPRGALRAAYFGSGPPGGTVPDSGRLARELSANVVLPRADVAIPRLVLGGACDAVSPPDAVRRLAQQLGVTLQIADAATHAMAWESGWEQRVSQVHRWLIHSLGEKLLVPEEDAG